LYRRATPSSPRAYQPRPCVTFNHSGHARKVAATDNKTRDSGRHFGYAAAVLEAVAPRHAKDKKSGEADMKAKVQIAACACALTGGLLLAGAAAAQIAVSANDAKVKLVNGVSTVVRDAPLDTIAIIDLNQSPPKLVAELPVPGSVVGPPLSVAITPDEGLALVTAAMKIDPADPTKTIADNRLSVVDLKAMPPKVIATLETGLSPAGLSITRDGRLALVANRSEGTVSVFGIEGKSVRSLGKVAIADDKSGVSHVAITPDGRTALVTRDGDFKISVLAIDGQTVIYTKREMYAGLRPYGIDISSRGDIAVVANIGIGAGDADTVSVIDMRAKPTRVVSTITVGQTPEGIKLSPDGSLCAVVIGNGSNKAKESPFYNDNGKLLLFRVQGTNLVPLAEAPIGHWSQGVAFSNDGHTLLVQNMVENDIQVFRLEGERLVSTGQRIAVKGGAAAIRIADKPL
jgi:DNA-binding beta-propeller fold protein YncE